MKKTILSTLLALCCLLSLVACGNPAGEADLWSQAIYTQDTQLGQGAKTVTVEVKAEDKTVVFQLKTDQETVGDALAEHQLIDGEEGEYGLYVKKVNGITADFDVDQTYWAFYANGEYATSGVDTTEIQEGVTYQLVRSK